eukprot:m.22175 g.22175  ORF g.22175 m.22175 type:complete len:87 (+) comp7365_c0_seq2:854-1114(+)
MRKTMHQLGVLGGWDVEDLTMKQRLAAEEAINRGWPPLYDEEEISPDRTRKGVALFRHGLGPSTWKSSRGKRIRKQKDSVVDVMRG